MTNYSIQSDIQSIISSLYREARFDGLRMAQGAAKAFFRPLQPSDVQSVYLPISQQQGEFVYQLLIENSCKHIVEFGTSFGISTLFLGAAAKQIGGKVITTEIIESKSEVALQNFKKAGLDDVIELRTGDALETLADLDEEIDFLFLDGWKDLYLPLFKQLEPLFKKGTIIYADNVDMSSATPFLTYIHSTPDIYRSQKMHQGKAELTVRLY
ncbi:MAG: class I SAM-dependent methyltransferase [Bacteroidota bacterium]